MTSNTPDYLEQRCECGKLLFKRTSRGFEVKCTRCKRIHFIPFEAIGSEYQSLCPVMNTPATKDSKK